MVYVNEKFWNIHNILYIVENVLKNAIQWWYFEKLKLFVQVYRLRTVDTSEL